MLPADFRPFSESEAGEKNGKERAKGDGEWANWPNGEVRRLPQEPAQTRGLWRDQARKNPNRDRLGFYVWWSWAGSNRRPQAICVQFYMCSRLIWVSLGVPRSDTLHTLPATLSLTSCLLYTSPSPRD